MLTASNGLLSCVLAISLYANSFLIAPGSNRLLTYRVPRFSPERVHLQQKIPQHDIEQFTPEMTVFYEQIIGGEFLGKDVREIVIPDVDPIYMRPSTCYRDILIPLAKGRDEGPVLFIMADRATNTIVSTGTTYNLD
ncbi:hypothetical protein [Lacunimicrobium album]